MERNERVLMVLFMRWLFDNYYVFPTDPRAVAVATKDAFGNDIEAPETPEQPSDMTTDEELGVLNEFDSYLAAIGIQPIAQE